MTKKKKTKVLQDTEEKSHLKHRNRLRDRFVANGLPSLSDHEIIELLLYHCIPRRDTKELAHKILKEFGSLHRVFEATAGEIERRCKITRNSAVFLSLVGPVTKRYELSKWGQHPSFDSTKALGEYIKCLFIGTSVELFYLICFDNRLKLISAECLAEGTIGRVTLYPLETMRRASVLRPTFVVLAHNHPSGDLNLSQLDISVTQDIKKQLDGIDIILLDHYIVAGDDYEAFSERRIMGLMGINGALAAKKDVQREAQKEAKKKISRAE